MPQHLTWIATQIRAGRTEVTAYPGPRELVAAIVEDHADPEFFENSDDYFWKTVQTVVAPGGIAVTSLDAVTFETEAVPTRDLCFTRSDLSEVRPDLFGMPVDHMQQRLRRHQAWQARVLEHVRAAAGKTKSPIDFVRSLQVELEYFPGAHVSFAVRNTGWLQALGYLEDRPARSDTDIQAALCMASARFEEPTACQDAITRVVNEALDECAPVPVDEPGH